MKYLSAILLSIVLLFACKKDPCATKADFLASFDTYVSDASKEPSKDTVIFTQAYKELVNDCYKKFKTEMTLEERQDFWKRSFKSVLNNFEGDIDLNLSDEKADPFNQYVMDEVKQLIKESGTSFFAELQDFFEDDLDRMMDIFSSEINNLAKEFMKMFQSQTAPQE